MRELIFCKAFLQLSETKATTPFLITSLLWFKSFLSGYKDYLQ